jgi:putative ABC transport system substrate-binding protein
MKKVLFAIAIVLIMSTVLAACGGPSNQQSASTETAAPSPADGGAGKSYTVGLIQLVEHPSLDEIRTAFTDRLVSEGEKQGYTIEVDYKNAQNDTTMINSICRQFVDDAVDAIVAIATPAAQGAATATSDIPVIFSAVTDPIGAGLVSDLNKPDGNITGTSDAIAVDRIFDLAKELTPGYERVGLIYNKGEANSVSVIAQAMAYLDSIGVSYVEKTVTSTGEVQQTARVLLEDCDAVFAPIDNTVATAMGTLADEAIKAGKPVYVAADSMVNDGGLATVGVNYTQLGIQTADMCLKALGGTPIAEIPVEVLTDLKVVVNKDTAAALGVDVSKYQ